jgi:aspartyl-tRNA(Asn)/glutamyl-tRNA(Gln) amidotransferase subunit A
MTYCSFDEINDALKNGSISCSQLVDNYLGNIEASKDFNIFLEVYDEEARQRATEIDAKIKAGNAGRLAGMVIALKDNICYAGHNVSSSSKILEGFESLFSATVTERLLAEDAIVIGRTNCDEFAMGSSNENSAYGPVKNPLDPTKVPGGSSGGSASAVAANCCLVSLGSDTGGSIRQPASFTGLVGYKPTYGLVSRHGLLAYSSSFDQIGPFAHNIADVALVTDVMKGGDEFDGTCVRDNHGEVFPVKANDKKKIAVIRDCVEAEGLDPEIKLHMLSSIEKLEAEGYEIEWIDFPYLDFLVPIYYVITTAEASSNLARYDGVHFGYRSPNAHDLESTYKMSRSEGFGLEVQRRIMLGTFVLSSGYYDAYFGKAQKARRFITEKTNEILENCDAILLPTSPHTAFELGQEYADPTVMYLEDIFTVQANIGGHPAISLPTGKHSNGLPFGIQLIGKKFKDNEVLNMSNDVMKVLA